MKKINKKKRLKKFQEQLWSATDEDAATSTMLITAFIDGGSLSCLKEADSIIVTSVQNKSGTFACRTKTLRPRKKDLRKFEMATEAKQNLEGNC